jgi:copper chaperone CopZ
MEQTITVEGMSCEHCDETVEDALHDVDGVTDATADHEAATASVDGDSETATLVQAVEDAGYSAHS